MKRLHLSLFVALLALCVWVTLCHRAPRTAARALPQPVRATTLTELALPGAALVASLDLDALRRSLWGRAALEQLLPLATKTEDCARTALSKVERLTLTIPAEGSTSAAPELALIAEGNLHASIVVGCATRVLRAHGGEPESSRLGRFLGLRDKKGLGELAVRDGGPLLLSGGSYFRALVARADRAQGPPAGVSEQLHAALRKELGPAPLLLTWVLPPGWLERWLQDPEVARSPLSDVRALALRGELGEKLTLSAILATESAHGAQRVEAFLRATEAELRPLIDIALGAGSSERIRIVRGDARVELTLRVDTRSLVGRWLEPTKAPTAPLSHPLGRAHPQEPQPEPQRAPRRPAHDEP